MECPRTSEVHLNAVGDGCQYFRHDTFGTPRFQLMQLAACLIKPWSGYKLSYPKDMTSTTILLVDGMKAETQSWPG
jgi:hypothetical protein